ncbi:MAG TPA: helix-turn-helix domain-containing protein [Chryseolinea sp.]|nr:helix-turn-helix domain-containing protein [Chryseolinea sp.]
MIYLFGLSVAFFLFALILIKKNKSRPDYILLVWIGVMVIHMLLFYLDYREVSYQYPHLLGVSLPIPVLHGVMLYFYTLELIRKENQITLKKILPHLVPFFVLAILAIPFYQLTGEEKIEVYRQAGRGFEWYTTIQNFALMLFGFAYSIASIIEIRKCRRRLLDNFSNIDKKMLRWLEYLAIGLAIIWLVSAFFSDEIVFDAVVLFVLFIGFFGINQYPVFYSLMEPEVSSANVKPETPLRDILSEEADLNLEKYTKSKLRDDEASAVMDRLEKIMSNQKPFTNADLTLNELANSIHVSPNHLSQVINTLSGKTFYHYINTYRIGEFLKLSSLPENRKFTYQGMAEQCGFSSKTTFNKYFKLQTGKTPSEYFGVTASEIA